MGFMSPDVPDNSAEIEEMKRKEAEEKKKLSDKESRIMRRKASGASLVDYANDQSSTLG